MSRVHLQEELLSSSTRVVVETKYGSVRGGKAANGAQVFLEIPYALNPVRFQDPEPLPQTYRYEDKDYIYESSYCAQPKNDGQAAGVPWEDKVGLGEPTEHPLVVNVVSPPHATSTSNFPVKVYIHGGFLQFGSLHGLSGQAQYVSAERSEVWLNIGYRLSAFGFLACDEPRVDGNFGFKDQWLALLWIKENIKAFGGNPNNIQVSGLSAGAHSVHQLLHHVSRLPKGESSPFQSALLQSNAIIIAPKTLKELRPQFQAFCRALNLDPSSPEVLSKLRDPNFVSTTAITHAIETDAFGAQYGTFRGTLDGDWMPSDPMEWQRSGAFAAALKSKGVKSIIVGDLTEEWYLYAIAHPVKSMSDVEMNLERYYQVEMVERVLKLYEDQAVLIPEGAPPEEFERFMGRILSEGQVHLPVRILARDMLKAGFPILRYDIRWTPEQLRPLGYVTHATDRALWALRLPSLEPAQADVARAWLDTIAREVKELEEAGSSTRDIREILTLKEDRTIAWTEDKTWDDVVRLLKVLPGES
ncbi:carboxylesterase [Cristinia sonorae]|uniref:Carboxylic ester hydrolase n=1 Tax=Cristinia sonorae TaxID=1940300 RepID=A0A8K0UGJ0_9AGAR|nr:carboxylesterase [Cristinia sonorae]